jgi:hypothetical protein
MSYRIAVENPGTTYFLRGTGWVVYAQYAESFPSEELARKVLAKLAKFQPVMCRMAQIESVTPLNVVTPRSPRL